MKDNDTGIGYQMIHRTPVKVNPSTSNYADLPRGSACLSFSTHTGIEHPRTHAYIHSAPYIENYTPEWAKESASRFPPPKKRLEGGVMDAEFYELDEENRKKRFVRFMIWLITGGIILWMVMQAGFFSRGIEVMP